MQLAGPDGKTAGLRAVPSLRYLQTVPPFSEHCFENEGDDSIDAGPTGGRTLGRPRGLGARAGEPAAALAVRDGQRTPGDLVERLRAAPHAARFRALWGDDIFDHPGEAFAAAAMALEVYQENPGEFQPFTQQVRRVLRGQAC